MADIDVIVYVSGGVVQGARATKKGVALEVFDLDNFEAGDPWGYVYFDKDSFEDAKEQDPDDEDITLFKEGPEAYWEKVVEPEYPVAIY